MSRSDGSSSVSYAYVGTGTSAWRTTTGSTTLDAALGPDESRLALGDGSAFAWLLPDLHGSDAWRYRLPRLPNCPAVAGSERRSARTDGPVSEWNQAVSGW